MEMGGDWIIAETFSVERQFTRATASILFNYEYSNEKMMTLNTDFLVHQYIKEISNL
jgi:hypothetical protein